MKRLSEFSLSSGESVLVEVEETRPPSGVERAARPSDIVPEAQKAFDDASEKVKPLATAIMAKLRQVPGPNEIAVEFGIKLTATLGIILASGSSEANLTIKLSWSARNET